MIGEIYKIVKDAIIFSMALFTGVLIGKKNAEKETNEKWAKFILAQRLLDGGEESEFIDRSCEYD